MPVSAAEVVKRKVVEVAPATSDQFVPSVLTCHWRLGIGEPLAAAVKLAVVPVVTVVSDGWVETTGIVLTVKIAALVVTLPAALVNTA